MRTHLTVIGNLTNHPVTRWTKEGVQVVEFGLAFNNRKQDRTTGLWEDGDPTFYTVTCWRRLAEGVASSLHKGDPVVVHGRFSTRDYERTDGQARSELKIDADAVGPDLGRAIAAVSRRSRTNPPVAAANGTSTAVLAAVPDFGTEDDIDDLPEPEEDGEGEMVAASPLPAADR